MALGFAVAAAQSREPLYRTGFLLRSLGRPGRLGKGRCVPFEYPLVRPPITNRADRMGRHSVGFRHLLDAVPKIVLPSDGKHLRAREFLGHYCPPCPLDNMATDYRPEVYCLNPSLTHGHTICGMGSICKGMINARIRHGRVQSSWLGGESNQFTPLYIYFSRLKVSTFPTPVFKEGGHDPFDYSQAFQPAPYPTGQPPYQDGEATQAA